ncbi:hypothetical protein [Herbidospora cretacea]|uniref:hypothetical protein n=1 Tax=Herbidospora cretacea TaxID=28444 RepID=UPI0007747CCD|nr:hypothetical protein [Herbidospora cretacea]
MAKVLLIPIEKMARRWDVSVDLASDAQHRERLGSRTLPVDMGVHIRTVAEVLGKSDIRVSRRYIHIATS